MSDTSRHRADDSAELSGALSEGPLVTEGPGLLVMDVDSTLIEQEVIELIAERAGTHELVAEVTARAMRGELDFAASLRERVATLAGVPQGVFAEVLAEVRPTQGAAEEVVVPLAEQLGIDHVAANRLEVVEGRLTGRVMGRIVDRQEKVRCLIAWAQQDGVPMERTIAVGDGANDLGMLEAAGLGVAFCAKPVVVEQADAAIHVRDLRAVLQLIGG